MMPVLWVKAGICGQETTIEVRKISQTKVSVMFQTTCEHVQKLALELKELNIGEEIDRPMNLTTTYILASKHLCRSSCVIPAAILKGVEVAADIFLPGPIAIEFIEGAI
jgi:hypothetical protein